jgi:transcriptional regulator with GAF, ATPase, and Fis domain
MVSEGSFREDLYFRLRVFPVQVPPLRNRREDIPILAAYFSERMAAHLNREAPYPSSEALQLMQGYDWPGNVRELEHAVRRAVVVCRGTEIQPEDLALEPARAEESTAEQIVSLSENERSYILQVLESTGWVISGPRGAAALLELPRSTLRSRMKKLGIRRRE